MQSGLRRRNLRSASLIEVILRMTRPWSFLALLVLQSAAAPAQSGSPDSSKSARSGIYPLPILFYTPETGIAGGGAAMYLYRDSVSPRASAIMGDIFYTAKNQIVFEISGDQYFSRGAYRLLSNLKYLKYPNKFYGVGNNTRSADEESYTPQTFHLSAVLYTNVFSRVNIGPAVQFENVTMKKTDPAGKLALRTIPGSGGGTISGVGFVVNWDSRDNTIAAHSGSLYQLITACYRRALGSDFSYNDIQIDVRKFFELAQDQVLALQAGGEFIDGTAPFHRLVSFGGQNFLRGYFEGRYRDNCGVALQAEYRFPVWWRFGLVGFAGAAQVAETMSRMTLKKFWLAGGVGLRFALTPEERVNLRLDYGWGNNSSGLYITVTEAF